MELFLKTTGLVRIEQLFIKTTSAFLEEDALYEEMSAKLSVKHFQYLKEQIHFEMGCVESA